MWNLWSRKDKEIGRGYRFQQPCLQLIASLTTSFVCIHRMWPCHLRRLQPSWPDVQRIHVLMRFHLISLGLFSLHYETYQIEIFLACSWPFFFFFCIELLWTYLWTMKKSVMVSGKHLNQGEVSRSSFSTAWVYEIYLKLNRKYACTGDTGHTGKFWCKNRV